MELATSKPFSQAQTQGAHLPVSIVAVITLYKVPIDQCSAFRSLERSAALASEGSVALTILLVDNSPDAEVAPAGLQKGVHYRACRENLGLAHAYNQGIRLAQQTGAVWLLTLDQDTELPSDFVGQMAGHALKVQNDPSIAAILPQVLSGETPVSPFFYRYQAVPTWFPKGYVGVPERDVSAINSASMLRVDALEQAGGYDPLFWLDASDMALFHQIHRLGKRALVAGDVNVQHGLSLKDLKNSVSANRYEHMLLAESAFWDAAMPPLAGVERTARLALRLLRQIRRRDPKPLLAVTLRFLGLRLFRSASHRRKLFLRAVQQQLGPHVAATALPVRAPKVSVCMASYNAGQYIDLQLGSILSQLDADDEVVIVDDGSSDGTPDRIRSFDDPRVRLIEHSANAGVTASFEHALRAATGDLLFLSDHDDIWAPNKVELFREAFARGPEIQLVMSAVSLIDERGVPFRNKRLDKDGKFKRGFLRNVLKNDYQGSALAVRSDLLAPLLPFLPGRTYLHDAWIGTLNDRLGGGMVFLAQPLLLYRRHDTNVSRPMSVGEKVLSRLELFGDHFRHAATGRGRGQRGFSK